MPRAAALPPGAFSSAIARASVSKKTYPSRRSPGAILPRELPAMASRILILSASVGAGHLRAAEAVQAALRELAPEAAVRNVDVMELTNRVFRRLYAKSYLDLVNNAPHL